MESKPNNPNEQNASEVAAKEKYNEQIQIYEIKKQTLVEYFTHYYHGKMPRGSRARGRVIQMWLDKHEVKFQERPHNDTILRHFVIYSTKFQKALDVEIYIDEKENLLKYDMEYVSNIY